MFKSISNWCVAAALVAIPVVVSGCDREETADKSREVKQSTSTDVKRDGTVVEKESTTTVTKP